MTRLENFCNNRILVVDDEEFCLRALQAILRNQDINVDLQVDFCINGTEAIETVKKAYKSCFKYSLILTDFHMPFMSGLESTKQIRAYLESEHALER